MIQVSMIENEPNGYVDEPRPVYAESPDGHPAGPVVADFLNQQMRHGETVRAFAIFREI